MNEGNQLIWRWDQCNKLIFWN